MYLLLLVVIGAASAVLAVLAWPHRGNRGFSHFFAMEIATTWWLFCYRGEQLDAPHARLWFAAKFPAIGLITASWFLFTLNYIGRPPRSRAWRIVYLWPVLLGPLLLTNDAHHLFFREIVMRQELVGLNGPLFPFHLALSYSYTLAAVALLAWDWWRTRRIQSVLLAAGTLLPLGANVLNEFAKAWPSVPAWLPLNPTLPAFGLTATFLGWAVLSYPPGPRSARNNNAMHMSKQSWRLPPVDKPQGGIMEKDNKSERAARRAGFSAILASALLISVPLAGRAADTDAQQVNAKWVSPRWPAARPAPHAAAATGCTKGRTRASRRTGWKARWETCSTAERFVAMPASSANP